MLRRPVLAALAAGIAADDDAAARAALRRVDPLIRGLVRRRLADAMLDAALAADAAAPGQLMRVAALAVAGRPVADPKDASAVATAYAALPPVTMPRLPGWSIGGGLFAATVVALVVAYLATLPGAKPRSFARPRPTPSAAAFARGGAPLRDPALDALLGDQLTDLVVAAGRAGASGQVDASLQVLRAAPAMATRGPKIAAAWQALMAAFGVAEVAAEAGDPSTREADQLREAAREVSAELEAAGLGYFLEGRLKAGRPFLQAYTVEDVVFVVAAGAPRRVLSLRRLDQLNTSYALLGMHSEDLGDPVVLLDQIEEHVATRLLPVLAVDAPYPLAEHAWAAVEPGLGLCAAVGAAVRRELTAALGADAPAATRIAALLVERGDLLAQWRAQLERQHLVMAEPDGLFVSPRLLSQLDGAVPRTQWNRVVAIDDELAELEAPRVAARLEDLLIASVRRHEAEHGFDADRATALRYPDALAALLGPPHDDVGAEVPIVRSARAELSAYLSQVANDPVTPQLALWNLGRQALSRERWGTAESYVAIVVVEGLARHLGATVAGEPFRRGIDRERLAPLARRIAEAPTPALRAAAAALWQELYGEPLTTIVDAPPGPIPRQG